VVLNASIAVLWSVYNARHKFIWPELSQTIANVLALVFLYASLPVFGIAAAAWATVLSLGLKLAFLMPILGFWQRPHWNSPAIIEARRRMKPFIFGQAYVRVDPLLDRLLSSLALPGGLTLMFLGRQMYAAINLVISKAINTPTVPRLAISAKAGE